MRRLLLAAGVGLGTYTSNEGLKGMLALELEEPIRRTVREATAASKTRAGRSRRLVRNVWSLSVAAPCRKHGVTALNEYPSL